MLIGGHGEDAKGLGPGSRVDRPWHRQEAGDWRAAAQCKELRCAGLAQQLPRERLYDGEVGIARIEGELDPQSGFGVRRQQIEAPLVETEDLVLEESLEELFPHGFLGSPWGRAVQGEVAQRLSLEGRSEGGGIASRPRRFEMAPSLPHGCQGMDGVAAGTAGREQQL